MNWTPATPPQTSQMSPRSFSSRGQGEWSDATRSTAPSRTERHRRSRSADVRTGGAHLSGGPIRSRSEASKVR